MSDQTDQTPGSRSGVSGAEEPARAPGKSGRTGKAGKTRKPRKDPLPVWQESILLLAVALVLAVVVKAFFVQAFYIPSESMEPGLVENDRILVQKVSYWGGGEPQRGDVVVFKDPGSWLSAADKAGPTNLLTTVMSKVGLYPTGGHLVKRVVGVGGDVIECCDEKGRLKVNGVPVTEDAYVKTDDAAECRGPMPGGDRRCNWKAGPVPEGYVFVMGDNRANSADSSFHMCNPKTSAVECTQGEEYVPVDLVVGKVFVLLWPKDHFGWIKRPDAFDDVPDGS